MKKTMTRKQILRALRSEPLRTGAWAVDEDHDQRSHLAPCYVCAVGACVRLALLNGKEPTVRDIHQASVAWTREETYLSGGRWRAEELAEQGYHWNALSTFFESMTGNQDPEIEATDADREELCSFVKRYFPKTIEVEVPG